MKRKLTSIVDYSSPFGLSMDRESLLAGLKSVPVAIILFILFTLISLPIGLFAGVAGFFISFVLRVGVIDGKSATEYIRITRDLARHPDKQNLFYTHGPVDDRLIISLEKNDAETKEKN